MSESNEKQPANKPNGGNKPAKKQAAKKAAKKKASAAKSNSKVSTGSAASSKTVTVEVVNQPIFEDGTVYHKGDSFKTTARRAEALGKRVTIVT